MGAGRNQRLKRRFTGAVLRNGNFSLALARNFDRVLATEMLSRRSLPRNTTLPLTILITSNYSYGGRRIYSGDEWRTRVNRLQGIDLKSYQCETIFVDPRAAVWTVKPRKWCRRIHVFLYLLQSGNVMQESGNIKPDAKVERLALFDQFPYTHHMECGYY